jgi:predicted Zn-dependent protease
MFPFFPRFLFAYLQPFLNDIFKMKIYLLILAVLISSFTSSFAREPVFDFMKSELDRNFAILRKEKIPAYYISLRMDELTSAGCSARMGWLQSGMDDTYSARYLSGIMRVGSPELDNSHEIREAGDGDRMIFTEVVPVDDDHSRAIKTAVWSQLDLLYKSAVRTYEQVKANIAVKVAQEDKSPDFTEEPADKYEEAPLNFSITRSVWEEKVRKYSAVFKQNADVLDGSALFYADCSRKYLVDTEGREIAQNSLSYHLVLTANTLTEDGMELPVYKSWFAFSADELPSDEEVLSEAQRLSSELSALKKAPVVESFTGPAILSPDAAGVFFHEIFGHRVEAARMKQENDAQTFKKKIGERVLPKHLSVTFDPGMKKYLHTPLSGYYAYDDEGIKARRVEVVKHGTLRDFLMCRTPIEGFLKSNGHGRAQIGQVPVSRQSNMLVESSQKYSEAQLRKMLIKEAGRQGKAYGYYFKNVSGGFTTTGRYVPNSFNVTPLVVYRIYTDGRPDELVRGVNLVGTPLAMFAQIEACGADYSVFNGTCGAESGGIPVSCVAPALFVKRIETQKRPKGQSQSPILPKPVASPENRRNTPDETIIHAIETEVERGLKGLKIEGLQSPFFISYALGDIETVSVTATLGSIVNSGVYKNRTSSTRLLIGDYLCSDENFNATVGGLTNYDGTPCIDNSEEGIRYSVWRDLDAIYKRATEAYEQKIATIKQLNIPQHDLELPDWDKTPTVQLPDLPRKNIDLDKTYYERYAKEASAVFAAHSEVINSSVSLQVLSSTVYFYNTEKSVYRLPRTFVVLKADVSTMTGDGEWMTDGFDLVCGSPEELPDIETLKERCHELARRASLERTAAIIDESYTGPVLYEGLAVMETFYAGFFSKNNSLIAARKPLSPSGYAYGGNSLEEMLGKRITAKEITIDDLTGTKTYNGQPLLGYSPIDAQGVIPPERLLLVENGILRNMLNDRVPTEKAPHSNGHSLFGISVDYRTRPGVVRLQDTRRKSQEQLRQTLLAEAKEEGYTYAYIVRETAGGGSVPLKLYRVSVQDGSEQPVRSAGINNVDAQVFKKILAVSDEETVHQLIFPGPTSVIVPKAILFKDMEIQKNQVDNYQKLPIVPRLKE